jgi:hypothetical protein
VALRAWTISGVSVKKTCPRRPGGAGGLQLGHFFLAHDAHAAGGLQREAGVVAEGGNLDARALAGLDEQRARGCGELLAVYGEGYVSHKRNPYSCMCLILVRLLKQNLLIGAAVVHDPRGDQNAERSQSQPSTDQNTDRAQEATVCSVARSD